MNYNYLITGYWGEPHITVENDRGINAAIFGAGRFVLPVGNQFRAEYIGNNTVRLYDGKLIDNGAVAGIPAGQYVDLLIPETGQGMKRNDLIVFQYSKDTATMIESGNFVVVNGAETSETAADPELTEQDILSDTATFDQMALWRVSVEGSVISAPVQMFKVAKNMENAGGGVTVAATSTDGVNYEATVKNVSELYTGFELTIIPNMTSKSTAIMLNVNGLGACRVRMPISSSTSATTTPTYDDFYAKDKPVKLIYDASSLNGIWRIVDKNRANALDLYGTTPIAKGGTGADNAKEARENLGIETANGTVTSGNADFAEVGEWSDGNTKNENRIGYFVCLDKDVPGVNIRKATIDDDVRGVTVTAPAFSGNCADNKFDESGALLPKYSYVAVVGIVSVIDDGTCTVGGRCMPNKKSIATAVTGECGYLVMERVDTNHVLIALEPGTDYQYKTTVLVNEHSDKLSRIPIFDVVKEYKVNDIVVIAEQTLKNSLWSNRKRDIYPGITYAVYINGTVYFCRAFEEDGTVCLGNPTLFDSASTIEHNNEPFCFTWAGGSATGGMFFKDGTLSYPVVFKVMECAEVEQKKLPNECLPDNVALKEDIPEGGGGANIDVVASVGQTIVVEEVDADGKPTKWKAAEFQERTHWQGENVQGDIVPLTTFVPVLSEEFGCTMYPVTPFKLEEGKSYTVIFDGVEYSCIALKGNIPNAEFVAIGNSVFAGGENNGMPFCVADISSITTVDKDGVVVDVLWHNKHYMVLCMDAEQHTVQVVGEKPVYHKIPIEYAKSDFVVEFTSNMAGGSICMVTPWEEIADAVRLNKNIYGVRNYESVEYDIYGNVTWKHLVSERYMGLNVKIGRDGFEQRCEITFVGLFGNHSMIVCTRDENGITTVETN